MSGLKTAPASAANPYTSPLTAQPLESRGDAGDGVQIGKGAWMALLAALLGWMFDGAEMGIFSMIGRQAVRDLLNTNDEAIIGLWFGVITAGFLVGAAT